MLKQAFRSYLSALHPRNIKKLNNGNGFWSIYFLFIYPMLMTLTQGDEFLKAFWFIMIKMMPFGLMLWSNVESKFLMPKAMFLCPMKTGERKEYINYVLLIKIGIPVLFSIVIELVWSMFCGFQPLQMVVIVFMHFSLGISTYICVDELGRNDQNIPLAERDKEGKSKRAWSNVILLLLGVFTLAGLEMVDLTIGMSMVSGVIIAIAVAIALILDIRIIATQYDSTIESAGNYENAFRILGKVPTNDNVEFDIFKK